jgi:hypothetical protein
VKSKQVFKLKGGTGNQLFIYFAALISQIESGRLASFEISALNLAKTKRSKALESFHLPIQIPSIQFSPFVNLLVRIAIKFFRGTRIRILKRFYLPSEVGFCEDFITNANSFRFIDGYFQTWKYFEAATAHFPAWKFGLKKESAALKSYLEKMFRDNPIIVHVRRGDYLELSESFGVLDEEYFKIGVEQLSYDGGNDKVWIFSDDPYFVQQNFKSFKIDCFPEIEASLSQEEVLFLMSRSNRMVVSNSTFSWWAATFAGKNASIVAPRPWFRAMKEPNDLIPETWLSTPSVWSR